MFARLLILLASLSLLVNLTSAANLRKDAVAAAAEIPIDHERAAKAYESFMKGLAKQRENDQKLAEESIAAAHANARKYVEDLHKAGKLAEAKSKASTLSNGNGPRIYSGAFVTRHRPNGDCSGIVSKISATKINGNCRPDGFGGSYLTYCTHEDQEGNVEMHSSYFTEEGCMNGWWSDQVVRSEPKCQYNRYGDPWDSPAMLGTQCTDNNMSIAIQSGGVTQAFFAEGDSTCDGSPQMLDVERYGACRLVMATDQGDNPQGFFYMTMDSCAQDTGKMQLTIYTDSACRRPVSRGSFNIGGFNGPYGTCNPASNGGYGMTICFPEGGM